MTATCPKCKARHEVSRRREGETFACACGNVLAAPKKQGMPVWVIFLIVLGAGSIPCIGILAAIAIPNFIKFQKRSHAAEAKVQMRAIDTAEKAYFLDHGSFVAAGPVPASVPGRAGAAFVPDKGFKSLGFAPEKAVRFQYEVRTDGQGAVIYARGDLDGDGALSVYKLVVNNEGASEIEEPDSP